MLLTAYHFELVVVSPSSGVVVRAQTAVVFLKSLARSPEEPRLLRTHLEEYSTHQSCNVDYCDSTEIGLCAI